LLELGRDVRFEGKCLAMTKLSLEFREFLLLPL